MTITAPVPLADHVIEGFNCSVAPLDEWLKRRARPVSASGASHTYVACDGNRALAYYVLAAGAEAPAASPGRFRRNMPDPIPVVVLGRLAIDHAYQGQGIGGALFHDAGLRVLEAADIIGSVGFSLMRSQRRLKRSIWCSACHRHRSIR